MEKTYKQSLLITAKDTRLTVKSLFLYLLTSLCCQSVMAKSVYVPVPESEKQLVTITDQKIEVLVKPWQSKRQRGAAILVGPTDSQASGSGLIRFLRNDVPDYGWATISIKPTKGLYRPNFATSAEEVAKKGKVQLSIEANKKAEKYSSSQLLELRNFQQSVIEECLSQIESISSDYPGKRILVATDDSAGMIINLLFEDKLPRPDLLVIVNPYREYEQSIDAQNRGLSIAQQLSEIDIPILDIQSTDGHLISIAESELRSDANQLKTGNQYRQYVLELNLNNQSGWNEALDHISGFARTIAGN